MQIFHVHTYRCGHAQDVPDEAYVQHALRLGAESIWFTDHAPFPGDPFGARMRMDELDEYLSTLTALKQKYSEISIHIGLETEYFPGFDAQGYYQALLSRPEIELLLLGQHMAEISPDPLRYSFSQSPMELRDKEFRQLGSAIVRGIQSGYFGAVAHPDRIFRQCGEWNRDMARVSEAIIQAALDADIPLEMNLASAEYSFHYKQQFWAMVPEQAKRIVGFDAHSVYEMEMRLEEKDDLLRVFQA